MAQNTAATGNMDDTHSIIQFLERPVRLAQFELTTATGDDSIALKPFVTDVKNPQVPIKSWQLPSDIMKIGGKDQKLQNFKYFRADVNIKLVLNANPFVAGRLFLTYSPYEDKISKQRQQRYTSRAGVTAYPGVEIDVQLDNTVEIVVPYASYREAYDLTRDVDDYVTLYLFAITDLLGPESGTTTIVDISVFAWFSNIELVIPTFDSIAVSPAVKEIVRYVKADVSDNDKERIRKMRQLEKLKKTNKPIYDYIMNSIPKDVEMQVAKEAGPGPIEDIASKVGDIARGVGGFIDKIPIVGEVGKKVADAVGWVADAIKKVASLFGWSKPTYQEAVCPLINVPGMGYTHYKGVDMGVPLALSTQNELGAPAEIFPSALDEMDVSYVCANPGVKTVVDWSTNSTLFSPLANGKDAKLANSYGQGTQVVTIGPTSEAEFDIGNKTYVLSDTVPCEFVSSLFTYWRATICFKISVVKTAFHTGRLEIFFNPGMYPRKENDKPLVDDARVASLDSTNNYKYILDITNDTEITVKIPYVSSKAFLSTKGLYNSTTSDWNEYDFENTLVGALFIRPITKLLAPPTVSDTVKVVVWKWAEDVELMCPKPGRNNYPKIFDINSANDETVVKRRFVQMQINISNKANGNEVTFFDSSSAPIQNQAALLRSGGEQVINFRILLRCFRSLLNTFSLTPSQPITINVQSDTEQGYDYVSYLSYIYRFFRGGVRFKFFMTNVGNDGGSLPFVQSTLIQSGETQTVADQGPTHITYPALNPVHEVTVPYYCQYRKLPISLTNDKEYLGLQVSSSATASAKVLRAGSDDFTFGWLVGTPQLEASVRDITAFTPPASRLNQSDLINWWCDGKKPADNALWWCLNSNYFSPNIKTFRYYVAQVGPVYNTKCGDIPAIYIIQMPSTSSTYEISQYVSRFDSKPTDETSQNYNITDVNGVKRAYLVPISAHEQR